MRCMLVGNYGVANLGDEALKEYFLHAFPEIQWTVVSAHPQKGEYPRLPLGIRSFLTTSWLRTLGAYTLTDVLIFGGGTLFTDVESVKACWLWGIHAWVARLFRVPYVLAFQGVGPFRTRLGQWIAKSALLHAAFVSVRDAESAQRIADICKNTKYVQSADPVILNMQRKKVKRSKNVIILIPRHNSGQAFLDAATRAMKAHPDCSLTLLLLQTEEDRQSASALLQTLPSIPSIISVSTLTSLEEQVSDAAFVITERYHGALAALAAGIPVEIVSQAAGDKLSTLIPYANGAQPFTSLHREAKRGEKALRLFLLAMKKGHHPVYLEPMMTLYLLSSEQALFDALPVDVREGWTVEMEKGSYADSSQKQMMRLSLIRLHDPSLIALRDKVLAAGTLDEVVSYMRSTDLRLVEEDDLAELCFALGPSVLTGLITMQLKAASTDTDVEGIAAISVIRHAILHSFQHLS